MTFNPVGFFLLAVQVAIMVICSIRVDGFPSFLYRDYYSSKFIQIHCRHETHFLILLDAIHFHAAYVMTYFSFLLLGMLLVM